jgi:hypothetical protein
VYLTLICLFFKKKAIVVNPIFGIREVRGMVHHVPSLVEGFEDQLQLAVIQLEDSFLQVPGARIGVVISHFHSLNSKATISAHDFQLRVLHPIFKRFRQENGFGLVPAMANTENGTRTSHRRG